MVVFTCAHCGESLQKPKVAKHYETKCRNNFPDLCCMDCLKDFRGDEYVAHTQCVSEAERYGAKGYVPKASQNKGERKQNAWIEIVQSVLDENHNLSGSIKFLLEKISKQPNTPRKKAKFINFVKSMSSRTHPKEIEQAWNLLSVKLDLLKPPNIPKSNTEEDEKKTFDEDLEKNGCHDKISMEKKCQNGADTNLSENKKKKKKQKTENADSNEISLSINSNSDPNAEENKKRGKKQKHALQEETVVVPIIDSRDINKETDVSEKKKRKKASSFSEEGNNVSLTGHDVADKVDEVNSIDNTNGDHNEKKLSKKERKEMKKREKYEAELKEIESAPTNLLDEEGIVLKKKTKKRKFEEDPGQKLEDQSSKLNGSSEANEENNEPIEKKKKTDPVAEFDWIGAITSVLGSKQKEISLKKLQKRVMAEYCSTSGASEINERIAKKYSKCLGKIPNIKIEHDKARLVSIEE